MPLSHFGEFEWDSTTNNSQCSLSVVSVESQSNSNPLRMETLQTQRWDCIANWFAVESPECESGSIEIELQ